MNHESRLFGFCYMCPMSPRPITTKKWSSSIFVFFFWKGSNSILWNYQLLSFNLAEKLPKINFWSIRRWIRRKIMIYQFPNSGPQLSYSEKKKEKKSNFSLAISPSCLLAKNVNLDHDIQLSFLSRSLAENCKKKRKPFILLINKYYFMTL